MVMKQIRLYARLPFLMALLTFPFVGTAFGEGLTHQALQVSTPQILRLTMGESKIIETPTAFKRVSVANPDISEQIVLSQKDRKSVV